MREDLLRRLRDHLALAETHPAKECPLDVRGVAAALGVSPTTLYKYGFNREINAAEDRQRASRHASVREIERRCFNDQVRGVSEELEKERERNKTLVGRIAIMEANAARLGFDPEEMYKPILKPARTTSRLARVGRGSITGTDPHQDLGRLRSDVVRPIIEDVPSTREIIRSALEQDLIDEDRKPVHLRLLPGLKKEEVDAFARSLPVPPSDDVRDLLEFCSGIEISRARRGTLEQIDFTGRSLSDGFGLDFLVPHSLTPPSEYRLSSIR